MKIIKTAENLNAYMLRCDTQADAIRLFDASDEWLSVENDGIVAAHYLGSNDVLMVASEDVMEQFLEAHNQKEASR